MEIKIHEMITQEKMNSIVDSVIKQPSQVPKLDYKQMLIKYMADVESLEGLGYIPTEGEYKGISYSKEESDEFLKIALEARKLEW